MEATLRVVHHPPLSKCVQNRGERLAFRFLFVCGVWMDAELGEGSSRPPRGGSATAGCRRCPARRKDALATCPGRRGAVRTGPPRLDGLRGTVKT